MKMKRIFQGERFSELWAALVGKARRLFACLMRNPLPLVFRNFHTWPKFFRRFAQNLLVGVIIEVVVHLSGHTWPVRSLENAALDSVMFLSADTSYQSDKRPAQLFIDVDERTWRSPAWGGGEPKTVPVARVADLVEQAARLGTRYVLVDFLLEGQMNAEQELLLSRMEEILRQYPESRFLFVRGFRRPLEQPAAQGIRPAFAVDTLMARHPDRVFAVAPNFLLSGGQVLRHWRLWESACSALPGGEGEGIWVVVPSPQLMITALEANSDIPWRLRFVEGQAGPVSVDPGAGGLCMTDGPADRAGDYVIREHLRETGYSARLADYWAGTWVARHFHTCYQQGFFSAADCERKTAPVPVLMREETAVSAGGYLANRVLFRQSDLVGKHELALRQGKTPALKQYGPHFGRIAAIELLGDGPPRQGPPATALKRFEESVGKGKLTVAVIGASYDESRDFHMTPLGLMPGSLVLVNAVDSLQTVGVLQELHGPASWTITVALLCISAAFALLSAFWASVLMCVLVVLTLGPLSLFLIKQGIWLNIAAPLLGIYLEHELDIFMEKRKKSPQH